MVKQILILASIVFIFAGIANQNDKQNPSTEPFAVANVYFEQNATDGDVEVVFEVKGGDEGLANLTVVSPDGRTIVDFTAPDVSTLGIRQFHFESPEKGNVESIKSAYPEGVYVFNGTTSDGKVFYGESTLIHNLPPTTVFLNPVADAEGVKFKDLEINWARVDSVSAYIIEISQDETDVNITAKLRETNSTFKVPDGFLLPDLEYNLSIGTMTEEGNLSFVETAFKTAGEE